MIEFNIALAAENWFWLRIQIIHVIQQERFSGLATANFSRAHVRDQIANFAVEVVGRSYASAIKLGFTNLNTDQATRFAFKVIKRKD